MRYLAFALLAGGIAFAYWRLSPPSEVIGSKLGDADSAARKNRMIRLSGDQDAALFI